MSRPSLLTNEAAMYRMYERLVEELAVFAIEADLGGDQVAELFLGELLVLSDKIPEVLRWSSLAEAVEDEMPVHLPINQ